MQQTVIILVGPIGSGKTTLANLIQRDHNEPVLDLSDLCHEAAITELRKYQRLVICVEDLSSRANTKGLLRVLEILQPARTLTWKISRQ